MIVSVIQWACPKCKVMHRREMPTNAPDSGHVIRVISDVDPHLPIGPLESIPSNSGRVTYELMRPVDLSCDGKDYL